MPIATSSIDALHEAVISWRPDAVVSVITPGGPEPVLPTLPVLCLRYPGVRQPRGNRSVAPHQAAIRETELGPSTGTVMLDGQPCTQHVLTSFLQDVAGFLRVPAKEGVKLAVTLQTDYATSRDVLQYVNADGSPSGEFAFANSGVWRSGNWSDNGSAPTGAGPYLATVTNLISSKGSNNYVLHDSEGVVLKTFTGPILNGQAVPFTCLPNLNWLIAPVDLYQDTVCSADNGASWQPVSFREPRGSTRPPSSFPGTNELAEVNRGGPLFLT